MNDLERIYAAPKSDLKRLNVDFGKFKKSIKYAKILFRCMIIYFILIGFIYIPTSILRLFIFTNF